MTFVPIAGRLRHKFGAVQTELDGIKFSSKAEARYYTFLKASQADGSVVGFLRQVPFYLPGNTKYVCDFQVFHTDGRVTFVDVKGMQTKTFVMKRKQVEALYPWIGQIEVVSA